MHFRRVSTGRVHCWEEISSFGGEEVRYDSNIFSGVFSRPMEPFLSHHWYISLAYYFVMTMDWISEEERIVK